MIHRRFVIVIFSFVLIFFTKSKKSSCSRIRSTTTTLNQLSWTGVDTEVNTVFGKPYRSSDSSMGGFW